MDRQTFAILCHLLRTIVGLSSTDIVDVEEMVVMFLHVLAHDVNVPQTDSPTYRSHKRQIATNVISVCDTKGDFVYVLAIGKDTQQMHAFFGMLLHDQTDNKFYYLYYAGYPNTKGFLAPYRGQRYHLQDWRGVGNTPTSAKEYFNMKHSFARNVIVLMFGLLKGCWAILRGKSYYPLKVQCRTILACCPLHNLINREMTNGEDLYDINEEDSAYATTTTGDNIQYIETTNEWTQWQDELSKAMFIEWQLRKWNDEAKCIIVKKDLFDKKVKTHPIAKGLLKKLFIYFDELAYVFGRDKAMGRFVKMLSMSSPMTLAERDIEQTLNNTTSDGNQIKRTTASFHTIVAVAVDV
ncbi:retrotransposon protein [Cucumis melo var. makuwa]|uniref:Retrotransposon protein n=1 Tax=Cucumis melo var. makuwa TaxID=1194695 RepID=A0A5D3DYU9_CUCMM|nr:retrotransposon protein [Cucumis melo var. makuwa]TYK28751.1 retrotransposon protein [Cucumis melo var. makuwa]